MIQHLWRRLVGREFRGALTRSKTRPYRRSLGIEPLEERQLLAVTVNTLVDEADGSIIDGDISLRDAISAAVAGDTINFDPALTSGGAATINLTLSASGAVAINKSLTIVGPGANLLTIDASGMDLTPNLNNGDGKRVFNITAGTVVMQGLTITGADVSGFGGAINTASPLTLQDCIIRNNSATSGGGIGTTAALTITNCEIYENNGSTSGGGVQFQVAGSVSPTFTNSTIRNNTAANRGGGIFAIFSGTGTLVLNNSLVKDNSAGGDGGGLISSGTGMGGTTGKLSMNGSAIIHNTSGANGGGINVNGTATITSSIIADNTAVLGGGLYVQSTATITTTTFANNTATSDGGGVYALVAAETFTQVTVSDNKANRNGGGVYAAQAITFKNSTIARNRADFDNAGGGGGGGIYYVDAINPNDANRSVLLDHTIVSDNGRGGGDLAPPDDLSSGGAAAPGNQFALYYGWVETNSGFNQRMGASFTPFFLGTDAGLLPLADNGGPSFLGGYHLLTQKLSPSSGAIDVGDPASATGGGGFPTNDQRGVPFRRLVNKTTAASPGIIDLGATEYRAVFAIGDYSGNGVVDAADYTVWRDNLGHTVTAGTGADGNGNGTVDTPDFDLWKTNFGQLTEGSGAGGGSAESLSNLSDESSAAVPTAAILAGFAAGGNDQLGAAVAPVVGGGSAAVTPARADQALVAWLASQSRVGGSDSASDADSLREADDATADAVDAALELAFGGAGAGL